LCVHASAFAVGREEEQIRALWRAARQRALLDEHWLTELLNPSSVGNAGEPSGEDRPSSTTTPRTPAIWMVPYLRNPHFTGRNELLDHLQLQFALRENEQRHTTIHPDAIPGHQGTRGHWQDADCHRIRLSGTRTGTLHTYSLDQRCQRRSCDVQLRLPQRLGACSYVRGRKRSTCLSR
jgi:hypothetical protein